MRPYLCCCYLICILYRTFILQMSITSSNPNSIPTITASSCSSTTYSMGNLSSGTGALTTGSVLPSCSTSTHQSLNAHSASNYNQDGIRPSGSFASRPGSSSIGAGASHVAPDSHPHSGSNSGKSVEQGVRGSAESYSSLTTNPSSQISRSFNEQWIQRPRNVKLLLSLIHI